MNKSYMRIFNILVLAIIACGSAFAVNSEFKNTLTNVDLIKTSENNYTVNLYTSKKYTSPVKVIKKSDLSYYILLPETKNIAPNTVSPSSDIRGVSMALYPYSGVDVNNGYTKINISTTHPINFSVSTRGASQRAADLSALAQANQKEKNIQKKNLVSQKEDSLNQTAKVDTVSKEQKQPTSNIVAKANNLASAPVEKNILSRETKVVQKTNSKVETKKVEKLVQKPKKELQEKNINKKSLSRENTALQDQKAKKRQVEDKRLAERKKQQEINKLAEARQAEIKDKLEKITSVQKTSPSSEIKNEDAEEVMAAAKIKPKQEENLGENQKEIIKEENSSEAILEENKIVSKKVDFEPFLLNIKNGLVTFGTNTKSAFENIYSSLADKLYEYGLTVFDLLFMIFAGLFSFVAVLLILSKKQIQPKIVNKSELIDKNEIIKNKKDGNEKSINKDEGKYFVFDKNIRQTELTVPAEVQEKKNYELVTYSPDIETKQEDNIAVKQEEDDLDIIQKILKEDNFVDIQSQENNYFENIVPDNIQTQPVMTQQDEKVQVKEAARQNENMTSPIGLERVQKENISDMQNEPKLLASYNIAPEKGFMFISYNNNINLMGFICDDVFVLHNYKTAKLNDYNLQYRLVDKDEQSNVYIVKTDGAKLLVKATKTSMNTEILM